MPENQYIEYKSSWHDEYLKWICGFANSHGGKLIIGRNDSGEIIGVKDSKRLLDDIPNKVKSNLGISVEVNLLVEKDINVIEVITQSHTVPISLRGRYYYRSGSTNQELSGTSLTEFLITKSGRSWDDGIEPRATIEDINPDTVKVFIKAAELAGRLPEEKGVSIIELFEKLRLIENGELKRAAIVLFAKDPAKFYPNTVVKIGRFKENDTELLFHETIEGNLLDQAQTVIYQLINKFLIKSVHFTGINRIETPEYPIAALREILLNALVHRTYLGSQIQIRVYDDSIRVWNEGLLPEGLTLESLKRTHSSRPRNPILADVCFKGGFIDAWGRGTLKILETCKQENLPEPIMEEVDGGFAVTLFKNKKTENRILYQDLNKRQFQAVVYVKEHGRITNSDYQSINLVSKATATRDLSELVLKHHLFEKKGHTGSGTFYILIS